MYEIGAIVAAMLAAWAIGELVIIPLIRAIIEWSLD